MKETIEIIKDIFTSILILATIIFVLAVIFYNEIPANKTIPESADYMLSKQMQEELEDDNLENAQEVIVNYYIDGADLKKYEKTKEYEKGKSNPFAPAEINNNKNNNNTSSENDTSSNNSSGNFYADDGTK